MNTTTLNIEFLTSLNACQTGIDFVKAANLEGFPLEMLDQVKGDYQGFVNWLRKHLKTEREYNDKGLMTKQVFPCGVYQYEYNDKGVKTKKITPSGRTFQYEYNDKGLMTKEVTLSGNMYQWEYEFDDKNKLVSVKGEDNLTIPSW